MKKKIQELENHVDHIALRVQEKVFGYILAAFGLVAGLAWNDVVSSLIDLLYPLDKDSIWAKLIYASILTILIAALSFLLIKFSRKTEEELRKSIK